MFAKKHPKEETFNEKNKQKRNWTLKLLFCLLTVFLVGLASINGFAASGYWVGTTDDDWDVLTNWDDGAGGAIASVPGTGTGETATFDDTDTGGNVELPAAFGNPVAIVVDSTAAGASHTFTTNAGDFTTVTIQDGASANAAALAFTAVGFTATGAVNITSTGAGGATLTMGGAAEIDGTLTITAGNGTGHAIFDTNAQNLNADGDVVLVDGGAGGGTPQLDLDSGSHTFAGAFTNIALGVLTTTGTIIFDGGAAKNADFSSDNPNNLQISTSGTNISLQSGTTVGGTLTIDEGTTLTSAAFTLGVTGTQTINGTLDSGAGNVTFTGALTLGGSGMIDIDNAGCTLDLNSSITTFAGTLKLTAAGTISNWPDPIVIAASGSLIIDDTTTFTLAQSIDNSAGGTLDIAPAQTLIADTTGKSITLGAGTNDIGVLDINDIVAITILGTGTLNVDGDVTIGDTEGGAGAAGLTSGANTTIIFSGNVDNHFDGVNGLDLDGNVTFDGTTKNFTLGAGAVNKLGGTSGDITFSGSTTLVEDSNTASNNVLALEGDVTISGTLVTSADDGYISIAVTAGKTIDNNGTFTLNGAAANRVFIYSATLDSAWTLDNAGGTAITFNQVAVRDCTYVSGGGETLGDGVVNATGNIGWPADEFDSPVASNARPVADAVNSFYKFQTELLDSNDTETYLAYVSLDPSLDETGEVTSLTQITSDGGAKAGNVQIWWSEADTDPDPKQVAPGDYYVYMDPVSAVDDYIIISDYTWKVSKAGFTSDSSEPMGGTDAAFTSFDITWVDDDGSGATIDLYSSTSNSYSTVTDVINNADEIVTDLTAASVDSYRWDPSALATPTGVTHYVYIVYTRLSQTSFDVSQSINLLSVDFSLPTDTGSEKNTNDASSDYTLTWTDWGISGVTLKFYASTTEYTTLSTVRANATQVYSAADTALEVESEAADTGTFNVATGYGDDADEVFPEGIYYIVAVADDDNGSEYDEMVAAPGQLTITHDPYFTGTMTVEGYYGDTTTADSGRTVSAADTITIDWAGNDHDDTATVALYYDISTTDYSTEDDPADAITTNATSFATGQAEDAGSGYTDWDYYSTSAVTAGTYYVWAVMTDDGTNPAWKQAQYTITISHSSALEITSPPASGNNTPSTKYYTIEWEDVDYDQSGDILITFSTTDKSHAGFQFTGGDVSIVADYTSLNTTDDNGDVLIAEDDDGKNDRFVADLSGFSDGSTTYIYLVMDVDGDSTYDVGYQAPGSLTVDHTSVINVTSPSTDDYTTSDYTIEWLEQWDNSAVDMNVDLYYDSTNSLSLTELDDSIGGTNIPDGIIERGISLQTGDDAGSNSAIWDDIVVTSSDTPTISGSTSTLIDTGTGSPLETGLATNYYKGRRLVITGGSLEGEYATITGYTPSTQTLTFATDALGGTPGTNTVTSYNILVPDGTYYVYAVLDNTSLNDNVYGETDEVRNVSIGTISITHYTVNMDAPEEQHEVNDVFNVDLKFDTNGQNIMGTDLCIDFDTTTLQLDIPSSPFCTVTSGTATTDGDPTNYLYLYDDTTSLNSANDYYNGSKVLITSGTCKGESRTISDYVGGSTGKITVSSAFSSTILTGVTFKINTPLGGSLGSSTNTTITNHDDEDWTVSVGQNSGNNTTGQADLSVISTQANATSFANSTDISIPFQSAAEGSTEMSFSFTSSRQTRMIDNTGKSHIPHNAGSAHIRNEGDGTSTIYGKVVLQGRSTHSGTTVTFELRKPGSLGHDSTNYDPGVETDSDGDASNGIQMTLAADGSFTLPGVPAGKYFLTAKALNYLRGQNDDSTPLEIKKGENQNGVIIYGYDSSTSYDYLLAGEAYGTVSGTSYSEDNDIDSGDLTVLADQFGDTGTPTADVNGDGEVDLVDFGLLAGNWGVTAIRPRGGIAGAANAVAAKDAADGDFFKLTELPEVAYVGKEVEINVDITEAMKVAGFDFELEFDQTQATVSKASEGKLFEKSLFVSKIFGDKDTRRLSVGGALLNDSTVSGSGTVATFKLTPATTGYMTLTLRNGKVVGDETLKSVTKEYTIRFVKPVEKWALHQNYPNPFNPETWIPYALKEATEVTIKIYNLNGRLIKTIHQGFQPAMKYVSKQDAAYWDGRNNFGERVASGIYFYRLDTGKFSATRKMVILK